MLDVAKAQGPTDDILMLLNESESIFVAQVPRRSSKKSLRNKIDALFYSPIASEILSRLHDCFLLFAWVPAPLLMPCWFCAEASAKYRTIAEINLLCPGWKYAHQLTNVDWRSPSVLPVDVDLQYAFVSIHWAALRRLCQIDQLEKIFTDPNKQKGLFKSAQEYAKGKVDEFVRAR